MKIWAMMTALVVAAGASGAADLDGGASSASAVPVGSVVIEQAPVQPDRLEWLRYVGPREGREAVVQTAGGSLRTIEWRRPMEIRARTTSGVPLSSVQQAEVRRLALGCDRGTPRDAREGVEIGGTYVLIFDCAWLQDQ